MGRFDGKVAIITGAGRGIGRAHALLLATEGASVVVNDFGGGMAGEGNDASPAQLVVNEIVAQGGNAVANYASVSNWNDAEAMIEQAVTTFGGLDILINNAGILRDRMSFSMTEEEFDSAIDVHLKGHFAPSRNAPTKWNGRSIRSTRLPTHSSMVESKVCRSCPKSTADQFQSSDFV